MIQPRGLSRMAIGLFLVCAFVSPSLQAGKSKTEEEPGKPKLKLLAEPSVGFTPVTALLTANLTGVAPDDANFCHPGVTWIRMNPGQTEDRATHTHEDPVCRHPESESRAATSFIKSFELYTPGTYLFRIIVEGKDHTKVSSGTAQVVVLRVQ